MIRDYNVKTLRSIPSRRENTSQSSGVRELWKVCAEEQATIDIFLMRPEMIESASALLAEFENITVGFCHCMDLKVGPDLTANTELVCHMARFPNLIAKVDFISTGTQMNYPCSDLHGAARKVIDAFGADRCVWGSNYPNGLWTPKVSYDEHLNIFQEALGLAEDEKRWILGETARRAWFPHIEPTP
jgi:predicted TIM-barrel fold metal-dependent hydrolase